MEHIIKASHEHAEACETVHRMHKTLQKAQKIMEVATAEIGRALSEDALGRACYFFTECIEAVHQGMMTSWDDTLLEAPEWTKFRLLFPIARKLGQRTPDGTKAALAGLMAIRDKAGFFRVGHVKLSHSQTESAELVLELALRLWLHYRRHGATKARWHEMFRLFGRCRYGMERDIGRHRHSNREHRLERCVHFFEDVETMRHEVQDIRRTLRNPSVNGKKKGLPGELIEQVLSYLYPLDTGRNILISDKALAIAYSPWPVRRRRRDLRVSRDDWEAHSAAESVCLGERHELPLLELPGYAVSTCPALTRPIWEAGRRQFVHKHILSP